MLILSSSFPSAIALFRAGLNDGEPVIFPSDTIYGMGAPLASIAANEKIFSIKQRPKNKPMPVLISNMEQLSALVERPDGEVLRWLGTVWPGSATTVVLPALPSLAGIYTANGAVAVRMLPKGWLADAVSAVGPITATSVNISGGEPLLEAEEISEKFHDLCRYMIWGTAGRTASTVIDISDGTRRIRRFRAFQY